MYNKRLLKREVTKILKGKRSDYLLYEAEGSSRVAYSFLGEYIVKIPKKIFCKNVDSVSSIVFGRPMELENWKVLYPNLTLRKGIEYINGLNQSTLEIAFFEKYKNEEGFEEVFLPLKDHFVVGNLPIVVMQKCAMAKSGGCESCAYKGSDGDCNAECETEEEELISELENKLGNFTEELMTESITDVHLDNMVFYNGNYVLCDYGLENCGFDLYHER